MKDKGDIKDYMYLYLGCDYQDQFGGLGNINEHTFLVMFDAAKRNVPFKLLLRPLSDIDKNEVADLLSVDGFIKRGNFESPFFQVEYEDLENERQYKHQYLSQLSPDQFLFLLSKHFDLFGLIESGLAIDKTKITQP